MVSVHACMHMCTVYFKSLIHVLYTIYMVIYKTSSFFLCAVTKEAAFVRALSVAALAHTIAMACGANLTTCQKPLVTEAPTPDADDRVIIQGIPENVTYGLQIAEEFFEAPIRSKQYISDRDYVILHNYRAGRLVSVKCMCLCFVYVCVVCGVRLRNRLKKL